MSLELGMEKKPTMAAIQIQASPRQTLRAERPAPRAQPAGSGVYGFTGTPAAAHAALRGLLYTLNPAYSFPPSEPGRTDFTIEVKDSLQNRTTVLFPVIIDRKSTRLNSSHT